MTLNIEVVGETGSVRQLADSLRQLGAGVEDTATGWHRARGTAEGVWEGPASESFQQLADRTGKDGDELAQLHTGTADALTVFADEIDTVKTRMAQAATVAREGELVVLSGSIICEPQSFGDQLGTQIGGSPLARGANQAQTPAQYDAAQALNAKKQAAFAEAQATVNEARRAEKVAHEKLVAALNSKNSELAGISSAADWGQASAHPTAPAATALAGAASTMEDQAANATRTMFERSMAGGPHAVSAAWASLSEAQRGDLTSRYPQMVGRTDGVPAIFRDVANRSMLGQQKQAVLKKLKEARFDTADREHAQYSDYQRLHQLEETLGGIEKLEQKIGPNNDTGYFLLGIDSTAANNHGHAIVANGNPDKADHVLTYVPGTTADLGSATNEISSNDQLIGRAREVSDGQRISGVMWLDYDAPPNLGSAADTDRAYDARSDLSQFQDGLRATHEGPTESHNTVLGHSYGSTVVGYAQRDCGLSANDIGFVGSPGVGASHADDLNMPGEHVWSGTAENDPILATHTGDPIDRSRGLYYGWDTQIHGMNPTDPHFGGEILPTDPTGEHGDYWTKQQSLDSLAKLTVGQTEGMRP